MIPLKDGLGTVLREGQRPDALSAAAATAAMLCWAMFLFACSLLELTTTWKAFSIILPQACLADRHIPHIVLKTLNCQCTMLSEEALLLKKCSNKALPRNRSSSINLSCQGRGTGYSKLPCMSHTGCCSSNLGTLKMYLPKTGSTHMMIL